MNQFQNVLFFLAVVTMVFSSTTQAEERRGQVQPPVLSVPSSIKVCHNGETITSVSPSAMAALQSLLEAGHAVEGSCEDIECEGVYNEATGECFDCNQNQFGFNDGCNDCFCTFDVDSNPSANGGAIAGSATVTCTQKVCNEYGNPFSLD